MNKKCCVPVCRKMIERKTFQNKNRQFHSMKNKGVDIFNIFIHLFFFFFEFEFAALCELY